MPAYAVAHMRQVTMGPPIVEYLERIDATLAPFGGRFLVHGGKPEVVEGTPRTQVTARARAGRRARSGEADVQVEVPEPQVEYTAAGPVHDERQEDDGQDYHDHPEEEHDDAGDGIPRYSSRSSHGCPLPATARFIQVIRRICSRPVRPCEDGRGRRDRAVVGMELAAEGR